MSKLRPEIKPRIVKAAPERRAELLGYAMTLFFEKGYEQTTINDILKRAGLSKGAFYHHFVSKEELLDAYTSELAESILSQMQGLLGSADLTETARLNLLIESSSQVQFQSNPAPASVFGAIFKLENAALFQRIMGVGERTLTPLLAEIVQRGIQKGEFDVPDPEIVVQMMVQLSTARFPIVVEAIQVAQAGDLNRAAQILDKRILAEQGFLDRILGLPAGSIRLLKPGNSRLALQALAGRSASALKRSRKTHQKGSVRAAGDRRPREDQHDRR